MPLGVTDPITFSTADQTRSVHIPLATTEGALVASVNRGGKAITDSGGATVCAERVGTTRGPVFAVQDLAHQQKLRAWLAANQATMAQTAQQTSKHLRFQDAMVRAAGGYVFVRFLFDTDEAMGMNMVTIATQALVDEIEQQTGARCISVAGNFDIDKKPAWMNMIATRGKTVWADVVIPKQVLETVLKTSAQKVFETWLGKCMVGSAMSGSIGFNCHFANVVAAFYLATGQDLAHVVEGSTGITIAKLQGDDLYLSVYLPAVMLGTVGGGTKLKTQTEARSITMSSDVMELAECLGVAVLAGELSLLSSLSVHTLARSHQSLGR